MGQGSVPKRPKGADCKSAGLCLRRFESFPAHQTAVFPLENCCAVVSFFVIVATDSLHALPERVVMVDGSFDPIHEGHVAYFESAAALGLPVLCNIAPDSWTSTKHAVLLSQQQRSVVIDAFRAISYVHASHLSTKEVLQALKPAIYAKGSDWKDRGGIPEAEQQVCDALGIEVVYLDTVLNSSSALLKNWKADKGN